MFNAKIDHQTLNKTIDAISQINDEIKLNANEDGWQVKVVDPANVSMCSVDLSNQAFAEYNTDGDLLGIDVNKLKDMTSFADKDEEIYMEKNDDDQTLTVKYGSFSYKISLLDPSTLRSEPKVPDLELSVEVIIPGSLLKKTLKASEKLSDHVRLSADADNNTFTIESAGDTDSLKTTLGTDDLIDIKPDKSVSALYSLDYFKAMSDALGKDVTETSIRFDSDFPMKMKYEIAKGNGTIEYLLAPRIENE